MEAAWVLLFVLFTFVVRVMIENAIAKPLIPARGNSKRVWRAIVVSNLLTHPINCLVLYVGINGAWSWMWVSPFIELGSTLVKCAILGASTRQALKSIYATCFGSVASSAAAVVSAALIARLLF